MTDGSPDAVRLLCGGVPHFASSDFAQLHAVCFSGAGRAWRAEEFDLFRQDPAIRWVELTAEPRTPSRNGRLLVGIALFRLILDEAELLTICRHPNWSGQSLGRILLEGVISDAIQSGADTMFLEVAERNRSARNLYEALGFREVGRRQSYYRSARGLSEDALVLRTDFCRC